MAIIGAKVQPYCRAFSWSDPSIGMPFDENETFPTWSLVPIAILPVFVYALLIFLIPRTKRQIFPMHQRVAYFRRQCGDTVSLWSAPVMYFWMETASWGLMQLQATMVQMMFVEFVKVYAGRLRPDFLSRLIMNGYTPDSLPGNNATSIELVTYCNTLSSANFILSEGHKSFPSGHSSTTFASMGVLMCFLWYQLKPLRARSVLRCFVSLCPLYFAFLVAVSRTRNNRHHFSDVLAGGLVGFLASLLVVHLHVKKDAETEDWTLREGVSVGAADEVWNDKLETNDAGSLNVDEASSSSSNMGTVARMEEGSTLLAKSVN